MYPGSARVVACALHGQRTDIPCGDRGTQPCGGYSHYTTAGTQVDCRPALDSTHLLQHIDQEMRVVLWRVHTWRRSNVHAIGKKRRGHQYRPLQFRYVPRSVHSTGLK